MRAWQDAPCIGWRGPGGNGRGGSPAAVFRGEVVAPGEFRIDATGHDLLFVWDKGPLDAHWFQWSAVLHGVTNPDTVLLG